MKPFNQFWSTQFSRYRIPELDKRHIIWEDVYELVRDSKLPFSKIGTSYEGRDILKITWGHGSKHVIAWAAMHGNETTSLRGWLDLFINLADEQIRDYFEPLLKEFTIHFIPLLNPDGALRYTRRNAMGIDMNRDARALQSPEMRCLMELIDDLKPALAFNLHDQRNIFTDGERPATISFLAPSIDVERSITAERKITMDVIGAAAQAIRPVMRGGIGRYTDEYYPTAIGERIQQMGIPTILVECGASKGDALRQEGRMLNGVILHGVLSRMLQGQQPESDAYLRIPINKANQADVIIRNVQFTDGGARFLADISVLEELKLVDGQLVGLNRILDVGDLSQHIGLEDYRFVSEQPLSILQAGALANFSVETNRGPVEFKEGIRIKP